MGHDTDRAKRRRARTGCLKCRTRRRKCDEEKPQCRNCRHAGHQCQYGTKLSFLEKNAITLSTPKSPGASSASTYRSLQFVESANHPPRRFSKSLAIAETPPAEIQTSPSSTVPERGVDLGNSNHGFVLDGPSPSLLFTESAASEQLPPHETELGLTRPNNDPSETSPGTGAYQTALDVLLSLGNDSQTPAAHFQNNDAAAQTPSTHASPDFGVALEPFATCRHAPQAPTVRLLRHFVYDIAPWLDTGDPDRTFRVRVSQLSLTSQPLLDALLALSSNSLLLRSRPNESLDVRGNELMPQLPVSSPEDGAAMAMTCVRIFMLTEPILWAMPPRVPFHCDDLMSLNEGKGLPLSVSWLILRLSLSRGLVHDESVDIPELLLHSVSTPSGRGWSRDLLDYDRQPLFFCARALNYCFARNEEFHGTGGRSKVEAWKEIFNSLDLWYSNRPQDFKPVLELEKQDCLFPLILFTNPAAILANQMYHTAMLLLLQHRPRTLAAEAGRSPGLSPLRHAQKICGIGLNNTDQNGWDFCLVASLYLAAKKMTYAPQQDAILHKIEQIRDMTGWNISSLGPHLRQTWSPL